jgi:DNA-binding NtrC family response regulator
MGSPASRPIDVLVADDDPDIRELLGEYFRERGLACATVQDGRAAISALERSGGRYGLILTDIGMPGADGFAVLEAARVANPESYVVMMTGFAALDTAIQAVRSGAQDYLTKPFSLGQIEVIAVRATARPAHTSAPASAGAAAIAPGGTDARLAAIDGRLDIIERTLAQLVALVAGGRRL